MQKAVEEEALLSMFCNGFDVTDKRLKTASYKFMGKLLEMTDKSTLSKMFVEKS